MDDDLSVTRVLQAGRTRERVRRAVGRACNGAVQSSYPGAPIHLSAQPHSGTRAEGFRTLPT
jgi:hypothetical protein